MVFVTLDASRLVPVLVARATGLPYVWSRMRYRRRGDQVTYACQRFGWPRTPAASGTRSRLIRPRSLIRVRIGPAIAAGPLEHHLTARWGLHAARHGNGTVYWPNEHGRWPLCSATVEHIDDQILAAVGFGDLADRRPDSVLFSPGVDVRFGPRDRA